MSLYGHCEVRVWLPTKVDTALHRPISLPFLIPGWSYLHAREVLMVIPEAGNDQIWSLTTYRLFLKWNPISHPINSNPYALHKSTIPLAILPTPRAQKYEWSPSTSIICKLFTVISSDARNRRFAWEASLSWKESHQYKREQFYLLWRDFNGQQKQKRVSNKKCFAALSSHREVFNFHRYAFRWWRQLICHAISQVPNGWIRW